MNPKQKLLTYEGNRNDHPNKDTGKSLEEKNYLLDEKRKKRKERKEEKRKLQQAEKRKLILIQIAQTKESICQLIEKTDELMKNSHKHNFSTHLKFIQIIKSNLEDKEEILDNDYLKTKLKILKSSLLKLIEVHSKIKLEVKFIESIRLIG